MADGACVGSFLNVVIYRIPADQSLVSPPSACPKCGHPLAWYDNVPILGWLWLRGACRYCRQPIDIQYPIVEAITATLFGGLFAVYYMTDLQPAWLDIGLGMTWPVLAIHLVLIAGLIAATLIDARLYIIPLAIPRVITMLAIVGLPLTIIAYPQAIEVTTVTGIWGTGAAAGGLIGLLFANGLLALRILPRSFSPMPPEPNPPEPDHHEPSDVGQEWHPWRAFGRESLFVVGILGIGAGLHGLYRALGRPELAPAPYGGPPVKVETVLLVMATVATVAAVAAILWSNRRTPGAAGQPNNAEESHSESPEDWLAHPHPQREVCKEALFVGCPIVGAITGALVLARLNVNLPVPVGVLGSTILGYLVGCGVVWFVRILGTLAFGREAMGLGDVHLLGAIGAVVGWLDSLVVFFIAPFLGLLGALMVAGLVRIFRGHVRVIPYGPYLAAAAALVLFIGGKRILVFFGILDSCLMI